MTSKLVMEQPLIILAAIVASLLGSPTIATAWLSFRRTYYRRFSGRRSEKGYVIPPQLPAILTVQEERLRIAASDLVRAPHSYAIRLQDFYHRCVGTGICALLIAFIWMAVKLTYRLDSDEINQFSAVLDVTCLSLTIVCFYLAGRLNVSWLRARARSELFRQWYSVDELLLGGTETKDLTSRFSDFDRLATRASSGGSEEIGPKLLAYWRERRAYYSSIIDHQSVRPRRLASYLNRRPIRQLDWFSAARGRLEAMDRVRRIVLIALYIATLACGLLRLAFAFKFGSPASGSLDEGLSLLVLCLIGVSSALSALYLGQNTRSLEHRYKMQERQISEWLHDVLEPSRWANVDAAISYCGERVLQFEDFMIIELVDWVGITSADIFELAPA